MSVSQLSVLCLVLAFGSSALGGFPFAQYPDFRGSLPSFTPHLIYGGNEDLAGFSYFTKDFDGGESEVVFLTGPNSDVKMNDEIASMQGQMSSWPFAKSEKEAKPESTENKDVPSTAPPAVPEENKESSTPGKEEVSVVPTTAESKVEDKMDKTQGPIGGQYLPAKGAGFDSPYPIFRLSGSAAFYPQASTEFSGFPEFPSDYFRSQYLPLYNQYNSYRFPYVPSYPSLDTNYYNPAVFPSVYQTPFIVPSPAGEKLIGEKTGTDVNIDRRFKPEEKETTSSAPSIPENSDSDKKNVADSSSTEKGADLPTSTEQMVEKSTAVSETASTTTAEVDEAASTTVVNDTVALP